MELFRVFDSLEYEDNESDKVEGGITASGALDEKQTKQLLRHSSTSRRSLYIF